jgi:hypothetical protein
LWYASRPYPASRLIQTLPEEASGHVYADVGMLREAGILDALAGSRAAEDADYRAFVDQTGFDYRRDLRAVAVAFREGDTYLAVSGRFNWNRIVAYAKAQKGDCESSICSMPASTPGRTVSFFALRSDVMAMVVSNGATRASAISPARWKKAPEIGSAPLWCSLPGSSFSGLSALPAGASAFLSPLTKVSSAQFTLGPSTDRNFELRLEAATRSAGSAAEVVTQLTATTDLLRRMLVRDKMTPNRADLSGVLVSGRFEARGDVARGVWPIDRRFLDTLASGKLQ